MNDIKNKVISVNYNLFKDTAEGEMIESTEGKAPLTFLSGMGQMIPDFENNVVNLSVGDTFSFGIKAENAYGSKTDEAIMDLPQDIFMQDGKLVDDVQPGNMLPLQDQNGGVVPAVVVKINETTVTMDLNHPLADQDLHFTGNVVEVREATADEVSHGHVHGEGGVQH
ncbi:peptidylprolyl isomerase [Vicingus serpentipes]|jgi:FKBP-type peptidyl-prolyl cis-trans isomerase SlyD|uniref:Peptidyl-prolyl cis-trans isomerase n=1 Tax=Vicingus serpentipes TaxID=1926625 RepID=A0A5C6RVQ8_9FLAO|nr:peptidylprolyl isomerase [Vicingus serpentipes]TXB66626.1 peptidylprolyl isomerase [Vicingus serpentipes]